MLWYTLLVLYGVGVGLLGSFVFRAYRLHKPDTKEIKFVALAVVLWPIALLVLIYIGVKANVTGNYEKGWFDWTKVK